MGLKINKEKLLERQARLKGEFPTKELKASQFFFPEEGKTKIRLLPWPDHPDEPFKEIWWYYNLAGTVMFKGKKQKGKAPMQLKQFGEDDPVAQRIALLRSTVNEGDLATSRGVSEGTEKTEEQRKEDLEFAKKLYASKAFYLACVVRGKENEGPKIFQNTSKQTYERLVELFLHDRVGENLLDVTSSGRDLEIKVSINRSKPDNTGKTTTIDFDLDLSPLSADEALVKKWCEEVPDPLKLMEKRKLSYSELEKRYQDWLNQGSEDDDDGVEHTESEVSASSDTDTDAESEDLTEEKPVVTGKKKRDMKAALAEIAGK